jgi:sulfur carrier protein
MQVFLNDVPHDLPEALDISKALAHWEHVRGTFAVAVNDQFIPKGAYETTLLNHGDRIDIIAPMQGG